MKLQFKNTIFKHLLFWVFFITYACIIDPVHGTFFVKFIGTTLIMLNFSFIYYVETMFILPSFYDKKLVLLLFLSLAFLIGFGSSYFNFFCFLKKNGTLTYFLSQPFYIFIINQIIVFGITSVMALGAYQNKIGIEKIKSQSEKNKALLSKELGFMKNQFNSNITFNFLTFCYNRIHKSSNETGESIEIFSRMLKHSLGNKVFEKVKLTTEIEYIEDFIKLQKLLSSDVNINFINIGDHVNDILIFPRILIAPVENAFKHGNIHSQKSPIKIELYSSFDSIIFKVANEKNRHKINEPSGIGYSNLKEQLELLYTEKYTLNIINEDNFYSCELKLHLG